MTQMMKFMTKTFVCLTCGKTKPTTVMMGNTKRCTACWHRSQVKLPASEALDECDAPHYEVYDGAELKPYEGRPGALEALSIPSMHMGKRVYWRQQNEDH